MILEHDEDGWCKHRKEPCEKRRLSLNGVCMISDSAGPTIICPRRLYQALAFIPPLHFKENELADVVMTTEQRVLKDENYQIDFVAFHPGDARIVVPIEVQAVNIVGNVGDEYKHLIGEGPPSDKKHAPNRTNMHRYLLMQLIQKGSVLQHVGLPYYVIIQEANLQYVLKKTAEFDYLRPPDQADVIFFSVDLDEQWELKLIRKVGVDWATFLRALLQAFLQDLPSPEDALADFLHLVHKRALDQGLLHAYHAKVAEKVEAEWGEVCTCGHTRRQHNGWEGPCNEGALIGFEGSLADVDWCECNGFVKKSG
jgi:hypothetical protein